MPHGTALITGSSGLIGSEAVRLFAGFGLEVHGIDNNFRRHLFGTEGDTSWNLSLLKEEAGAFTHHHMDIRDGASVGSLISTIMPNYVLHCAAQPAHEYARQHPLLDFDINVTATLNLLEACRKHVPESPFIFCSSSKVYGPINDIPYTERESRYELTADGALQGVTREGINETFPLGGGNGRGIYGSGKAAADLLVQEYGQTYGLPTVCLRGNCMTGAAHSPTELHGFLAYLARCLMEGRTYTVFGHKGKQVRDVIHATDFVNAMVMACLSPPQPGAVYNVGGGRANSLSLLEAVETLEVMAGKRLDTVCVEQPRHGDHRVYISDTGKFRADYPGWGIAWSLEEICADLIERFDIREPLIFTTA